MERSRGLSWKKDRRHKINHARWRAGKFFYYRRCKTDMNIKTNIKVPCTWNKGISLFFCIGKRKRKTVWKQPTHTVSYGHLLINQVGLLFTLKVLKMIQVENVGAQNLEYQKIQELLQNVLTLSCYDGPDDTVKQKLNLVKDQGEYILNVYQSYFHYFTTDQTLSCPEFIDWCANNYSLSGRLIMDISNSKMLCLHSLWLL